MFWILKTNESSYVIKTNEKLVRMVEILQIAELEHVLISSVYVVVQFYSWFNFYFPLLLCMVMYDNEYKVKENKN